MLFAVSMVCASFFRRVQSRKICGRVWERSVYLYGLCLSYEMILASIYPFTHSNRTPLSCWCLAVIAGWAALDLLSNPQENLPKLSKRFHAGVWGHFTCHLFASFPGPGKCSCTSYTADVPGHWIKPCRLIWKSEQAVPFCCFKNSISQGAKQDWRSLMCSDTFAPAYKWILCFVPVHQSSGMLCSADKLEGLFSELYEFHRLWSLIPRHSNASQMKRSTSAMEFETKREN